MVTIPLVLPPEVPSHPSAEELALYRHVAVDATEKMIQRVGNAFGMMPMLPRSVTGGAADPTILDALNAQGDYFIARMRWMDDHLIGGE